MAGVIVYLHGFQSSPGSYKARLIEQALRARESEVLYFCPQLPLSPAKSVELVLDGIHGYPTDSMTVVGSSLGGYYATWLAERCHCKAVLLNPVVDPWQIKILDDMPDLADLKVREWLAFREQYERELTALRVMHITDPARYMLIAAKGDALLDWRLMQSCYPGAQHLILEGGDHGLSDFPVYLDAVFRFCGI